MFEQLGSPTFTHFLLGLQGREIVLLLEDGEAVLQKRADSKDHRSAVVSLLLNLTDGFLNDLCKVQVVGTFNIDATEIDDALLRNGRLIAMREFGPLSAKEARKLGEHLGKDTKAISGPTMLTDVFHLGNEVTLTQKKKSSPIGFGVRVERVPPG